MKNGKIIFFGTGGVARAYCENTGTLPDLFVDNDQDKWGSVFEGVKICSPAVLKDVTINKVVITSSYLKEIKPQILRLGVPKELIVEPSKKLGSLHLFRSKSIRLEAAKQLYQIMSMMQKPSPLVAVGGSALGFVRDNDFIQWDDDIDLFAPLQSRSECIKNLISLGLEVEEKPESPMQSLVSWIKCSDQRQIPVSIDFFTTDQKTFIDTFEDYSWEWPTEMFTNCHVVNVHGYQLNVPNPPGVYLSHVYGDSWATPNPEFGYSDYQGTN